MALGDRIAWLLATAGGLGLAPAAPGTFGTLGGVVLAVVAQVLVQGPALAVTLALLALVLLAIGCRLGPFARRVLGGEDPRSFVLDEVVGYLVTLTLAAAVRGDPTPLTHAVAFAWFRAFDVVKPPPIRRLEHLPGGCGIMMDDVMAGLYAGVGVLILGRVGWA
ncbi:MAG: phosphatidylglycerophosphatase A [Planctomycetes bacterium]|nr:phosphatidylglycerophosphatase A [Planctomycetota bacterium]